MKLRRSLGAGALAGALGTVAMDLLWYRRYRREHGRRGFAHWEFADDVVSWDTAPAPGQVGRKVEQLVLRRTPPEAWARPTTNVVHWATGVGWGLNLALARSARPRSRALGLALGPAAWLASYAVLPLIKVYKPIWKYDARTLGKDLSAHLVYGVVAAVGFELLTAAGSDAVSRGVGRQGRRLTSGPTRHRPPIRR
jgi:hypothetical protein